MTKQDRQTDKPIIDVEFLLYELLGLDVNVLQCWKSVHETWRWKSSYSRGTRTAMRTTGQATTALGNVITNMQVHAQFTIDNYDQIQLMLLLGDDNLMLMTQ